MADDGVVDVVEVALEVLERVLDLGRQRRGEREESEREESFEGSLHRGVARRDFRLAFVIGSIIPRNRLFFP